MVDFTSMLLGAVVGGAAVPTIKRLVDRALERSDLVRDGLVDLNSLIQRLEGLLPQIVDQDSPHSPEDLVGTPSGYFINGPFLSAQKYLSYFDCEELHRLFLLIFDAHRTLLDLSGELSSAFQWLITHKGEEWSQPAGKEHHRILTVNRAHALEIVRQLLRYSSEACELLAKTASTQLVLLRGTSIERFLLTHYGITKRALTIRAAYYRQTAACTPFDPENGYVLYRARAAADIRDSDDLILRFDEEDVQFRPGDIVAAPASTATKLLVYRDSTWKPLSLQSYLERMPFE